MPRISWFVCILKFLRILNILFLRCPVDWGCRIHKECPRYDTKESDGEVPVILGLKRMWSTPSMPLLPGPLKPGMVAPDRTLSMG